MSGRDPAEAVEQLFGPLQRALSRVTPSVLTGRRYRESPLPHVLFFESPSGFSPLGRVPRFSLAIRHFSRLSNPRAEQTAERWRIATVGSIYEIADRHPERVVAYHWHPPGSGLATPHLHVGRQVAHPGLPEDVRGYADRLVRSHLPTGPIVLPTVLRLAIAESGVEPLRDDWQGVLDEAEREVRRTLPTEEVGAMEHGRDRSVPPAAYPDGGGRSVSSRWGSGWHGGCGGSSRGRGSSRSARSRPL